jgi:glycosyltransferase involved in cell wall biosynthesis
LYQPLSTLIHFEGVSSGVDLAAGVKQYQVANGKRFFERWKNVLESHRPNGVDPSSESERAVRGRLLIIDAVTPTPDHDAGSLVMMEMIRSFKESGWRTSFIPEDNFAHLPDATPRVQRAGIEAIYWPQFKTVEEFLRARGREFDIVLISRVACAEKHLRTVRRLAPHARIIFNTVDLHYLREAREATLAQDSNALARSERTKAVELAAVVASDLTIVHSVAEKEILAKEAPAGRVYVFPWVAEAHTSSAPFAGRRNVVFVGGFRHAPNVDGLAWFVRDVWPLVRAKAPTAALQVVGADAPPEFAQLDGVNGVRMMGWIPDLDDLLGRARLTVAPLRYGAGVKGKVVSSLSSGVPVVGTKIAAEGMGLALGQDVLVADDPAEFADAVVRVLNDDTLWAQLSTNGLKFVDENYSRTAARRRVREMVDALNLTDR